MKPIHRRQPYRQLRVEIVVTLAAAFALAGCRESPSRASPPADATPATVVQRSHPTLVDAAAVAEPTCGAPGQPLCPLEAWMEAELSLPLQSRDWEHLTRSLGKLAASAPEAYPRWAAWAKAALPAARSKDVEGVRDACRDCHEAYRDDYRRHMPNRPAPAADVAAGPDRREGVWGRIPSAQPK